MVENRGGNASLVCTYGVAGSLSQDMPESFRAACPSRAASTASAAPASGSSFHSGEITLTPGRGADLDRGNLVDELPQSDLAFAGFSG
jgi:hypothetical protein